MAELLPYTPTPEEEEEGYEPWTPDASPAELIQAAESYVVAKRREWERDDIVKKLQRAYQALDAFRAACEAQGWEVSF